MTFFHECVESKLKGEVRGIQLRHGTSPQDITNFYRLNLLVINHKLAVLYTTAYKLKDFTTNLLCSYWLSLI